MRLRIPTVIVGAFLLVSPACDKEDTPAPETKAEPEKVAPAPEPEPEPEEEAKTKRVDIAKADPPTVTIDRAGANPKEVLRLAPTVGEEESVVMTMTMKMKMAMAGQRIPAVTTPPIVIDVHARVDELKDTRMKITYAVDGMHVGQSKDANPAMVETLKSMLDNMDSFQAHLEMDLRGVLYGGYVDVPVGLPAPMQQMTEQLQQSFAQLQVPLPEEAVGVGAKWTAVSTVDQGGMQIEQTAKYQLLSREGTNLKLKLTVSQKLVDPNFKPPGMPGVSAKIGAFQSGGGGKLELSLAHLTPTSLESTIKLKMAMDISAMGQQQKQDMEMEMALVLARK